MKILFPVDGSDVTKRMLSYIAAHDELLGAGHEFTFVTVVTPVPVHATRFVPAATISEHYQDEARKVFDPIQRFAEQNGWQAQMISKHGHAVDVIATMATDGHFGLVVMGTHGHTSLTNVVLGSVANGVLARTQVPVLLIR